jgi:thioredoxin-related protein
MSRNTSRIALASLLLIGWFAVPADAQNASSGATQGQFIGAMPTEYPAWFKESFLEFQSDIEEAAQAGKRVLVLFHQDGCPYCNRLVETNLAQKDIEQYVRENFDVIAVNMWGDREVVTVSGKAYAEKTFAAALRVQFTPTLIFFDERGKVALRLNGYLPPAEFKLALRYVAEKREQNGPYREYLKTHAPPRGTGTLNAQTFFSDPPYDLTRDRSGRPIAVFLEQLDCPNCDTLHSKVLDDEGTRGLIEKFDVVQLDMWSKIPVITPDNQRITAREWAKQLEVTYAPSIVLFDSRGAEVIRSEAYFKIFHTQSLFDYVVSGGYRHEPSFQRFISERADKLREQGVDVNIWN